MLPDAQDEAICRFEIERLADGVWDAMPDNTYPLRVIQASNTVPCSTDYWLQSSNIHAIPKFGEVISAVLLKALVMERVGVRRYALCDGSARHAHPWIFCIESEKMCNEWQ